MCGIAGSILQKSVSYDKVQALITLIRKLSHRGPNFQKVVDLGCIQLAHARLSILDTRESANQPMFSKDDSLCVVLNGEIYNYLELREELITLGYTFNTSSDTEVLVYAWKAWGKGCLMKLSGMFAFALWDNSKNKLYLVRDRVGEKPLFYSDANGFVFASEIRSLSAHPAISKKINYQAINQFLSLNYILTNQSIYKHIKKLPPAHYLEFDQNTSTHKTYCYWDLASLYEKSRETGAMDDALSKYNYCFSRVVKEQCRSDVSLGAYLSGGLDSSSVVEAMCQHEQAKRIKTFSIDFHQKSFSELTYSQKVSRYFGVEHHVSTIDIDSEIAFFRPFECFGEPFADTSLISCYYLSQFAKKEVTVVLGGDGSDELFAGYETYLADRYYKVASVLPKPIKQAIFQFFQSHIKTSFDKVSFDYKLKQFLYGLQFDFQKAHFSWREVFSEEEKFKLCRQELCSHFDDHPFKDYQAFFKPVSHLHWVDQVSYVDIKTWLVDDILVKTDRTSMAHSLELRSPFLNEQIIEMAAKLPHRWKLNGIKTKYFLKKANEKRLPKSVVFRKKRGFNSPVADWLCLPSIIPYAKSRLFSKTMTEMFNDSYLENLWLAHQHKKKDNSLKLYGLLSLSAWLDRNI